MIWKDNTVIMAGSEFSPLGQRISAAGFGANPLEMRLPVTMFERLDMNTLSFPTCCVLIDYLEDGMQCNFLRRNFCISCKTVVFMMLVNISYGSFI